MNLIPRIFKHWIHSHEEDTGEEIIYRPSSYDFPLSRSRTGFEIKENGEFIQYDIAPDDRIKQTNGNWKQIDDEIQVNLTNGDQYNLKILSLEEGILKIKR